MIIERPCTSCGFSLEKGVKIVFFFDIVVGAISIIIWGTLLHTSRLNSKKNEVGLDEDFLDSIDGDGDFNGIFIALLAISILQFILSFLLLIGIIWKKVLLFYIWILASTITVPVNGVLPKIYEMVVVYAYTEELASDAHGTALMEFRKLPYTCKIETQHYPPPAFGLKRTRESVGRKGTAFLQRKSIFMQVPPVFQSHLRV